MTSNNDAMSREVYEKACEIVNQIHQKMREAVAKIKAKEPTK